MQPQQDGAPVPPYWTRSQGPAAAASPAGDRSSAVGTQEGSSILSSTATGEPESPVSPESSSYSRQPVIWASSVFGWEDTIEMEDTGGSSSKQKGEKFDGRLGGLSVADLKLGYQNQLQLLRSRRSATAATLTDEDKFAVLLDMCAGDAYHVLQDHFRGRLEVNARNREETEAKNRDMEVKLAEKWHKAAEEEGVGAGTGSLLAPVGPCRGPHTHGRSLDVSAGNLS